MDSPDYAPSEPFTPVKGAGSPDCTPSKSSVKNSLAPAQYHYPTPPDVKPKIKMAPGNLQVNTQVALPMVTRGKGPRHTVIKSEDDLSVQERRALKSAVKIIGEAHGGPKLVSGSTKQDVIDKVSSYASFINALPSEATIVVAMNPFYDEMTDGDYYVWLHEKYYKRNMPEIVRRANAFRGFPQLDEQTFNPQGWEEKYAHYHSEEGIREMAHFQPAIDREEIMMDLVDLRLYEHDQDEEVARMAFLKTWGDALGITDTQSSAEPLTPVTTPSLARPEVSSRPRTADVQMPPAANSEPSLKASVAPAVKAKYSKTPQTKLAPKAESAVRDAAGSSKNASKKKRKRCGADRSYMPERFAGADESDDDSLKRKPSKKQKKWQKKKPVSRVPQNVESELPVTPGTAYLAGDEAE